MVATGHGDKVIRIWDPRADGKPVVHLNTFHDALPY